MTENDPGGGGHDIPDAGAVGARREEVGTPIPSDERMSLNLPPKELDGMSAAHPVVPSSRHDGTPRLPEGTAGGTGAPEAAPAPGRRAAGGTGLSAAGAGSGQAGTGAAGGADSGTSKESVRRDIERDRRELGDTVEALMHKTDVKGRVQETATQVGDELRRVRAATATTATEMVERVKEATPVEIKDAAGRVTTEAGKRPVALVAAVAVLGLVVFRALSRGRGRGGRKRR
ncbi:DUF3618 domain-containing protein [Streptosporangium sp. NPDC006007]|uniref:DUF3618 domain-containing protein n=1 Tax=Streptosporangium sp. NPDC006007 TaxID=3154575 RepID=UPI0033B33BE6